MSTASEVYTMLGNAALWQTAQDCHRLLTEAGVPHAIVGGVAVCLHGYQRNTVDLDLLIQRRDAERIREVLQNARFTWDKQAVEFQSPSGIAVQFLLAGEPAGKLASVLLPDPADPLSTTEVEALPVVSLARLIEIKIACGEGSVRRTHKDFADVVELIDRQRLDGTFARFLHKSVRATFRKLVRSTKAE